MPNKHLNYWRRNMPECRYVNLYGPTEITVDCTYYTVEREFNVMNHYLSDFHAKIVMC